MIPVKIKRVCANPEPISLPSYQTPHAAGMDLTADISQPFTLKTGERALIPTGIAIELPVGFEAQIRPRSGLAIKQGITCLNTPGTIDADYRGEIKVILINLGQAPVTIHRGDRIAQMVVSPVTRVEFVEVRDLNDTQRKGGGFGSTGMR